MNKRYWKSLGYSLFVANVVNLVALILQSAYGYQVNIGFSFLITNVIAFLYWLFWVFFPRSEFF